MGPLSGETDEMRGGDLRPRRSSDDGSCSGGGEGRASSPSLVRVRVRANT